MKNSGILAVIFLVLLTSCYDDYVKDYDYKSVYFTYPVDTRTFVVGEGMQIKVGVALAGALDNKTDRVINFSIQKDLVTPSILEQMQSGLQYMKDASKGISILKTIPSDYYHLSDPEKIIIKKGEHVGYIILKADSVKFLSEIENIHTQYAIPFYIESADADSILSTNRSTVIGLKYENTLFGNYWHGGVRIIKDAKGNVVKKIPYPTTIPQPENLTWTLKTVSPFELETNGLAEDFNKGSMRLKLNPDGTITVSKSSSSNVEVTADGECKFNQSKLLQERQIFLKYKFDNGDGTTSHVTDTLTFRNRIRDGVNEWQDENPEHYK